MALHKILIADEWVESDSTGSFSAVNPATRETLPDEYPVSSWAEIDRVLDAAAEAAKQVRGISGDKFADFLEAYANQIEERADDLVAMALSLIHI